MRKPLAQKLSVTIKKARVELKKLTPVQKKTLEKTWDVEHAYFSSALEGSKITRKEFEKLAKKIA